RALGDVDDERALRGARPEVIGQVRVQLLQPDTETATAGEHAAHVGNLDLAISGTDSHHARRRGWRRRVEVLRSAIVVVAGGRSVVLAVGRRVVLALFSCR